MIWLSIAFISALLIAIWLTGPVKRQKLKKVLYVTTVAQVALFIITVWALNWLVALDIFFPDLDGDTFNVSSSLFAALALLGVAYSLHLQRSQNKETSKALLTQAKQVTRQNFEGIFFQLLRMYSNVVDNFTFQDSHKAWLTGQQAINELLSQVDSKYAGFDGMKWPASQSSLDNFRSAYSKVYTANRGASGAYFRTIHTILRLLSKLDLPEDDKRDYAKILRAQMSDIEASFLTFNYLSNNTTDRFNPLIVEFRMLKNADVDRWQVLRELLPYIPAEAFGSRKAHDTRAKTPEPMPQPDNREYNQY